MMGRNCCSVRSGILVGTGRTLRATGLYRRAGYEVRSRVDSDRARETQGVWNGTENESMEYSNERRRLSYCGGGRS